jgi:hypothetical protein
MDMLRIPSKASEYSYDYRCIKEFCDHVGDPIVLEVRYFEAGSYKKFTIQPEDPAVGVIKGLIRDINESRMAACRREDLEFRINVAEKVIAELKERIMKE